MSTPADPYSILNKDPNRGKIVQKKKVTVSRLWAGKVPEWPGSEQGASKDKPVAREGRKKFETEIIAESSPKDAAMSINVAEELGERYVLLVKGRERMKQQLLQNEEEENPDAFPEVPEESAAEPAKEVTGKEDEEMGEDGQDEENNDEAIEDSKPLLKPMFVSKDERATVKERERKQQEEEAKQEAAKKRLEQLQIERKMMVIKAVFSLLYCR
eukprot:TRINITY_DN5667_c0_g1_i2.p1 TRINITY_DN5667_c0_g1~~TRINITY_DN5667_c0_g1_i2.p1  ORF type:complete len:214 (+),score=76.60 TRINITY_DN5667_c0_g1_i2:30-671(+)